MTKYSIVMDNTRINQRVVIAEGFTKAEAEKKLEELASNIESLKQIGIKVFLKPELTSRQAQVDRLIKEAVSEFVGGYENTMQDFPEDSDEYKFAKAFLEDYDALVESIENYVKSESKTGTRESNIRFAGNAFLRERIEYRLAKFGYKKH